jgi:hypothetical protein
MPPSKHKMSPPKDKSSLPKDQEVRELSGKDGIFLMHILHNLLSNGAKVSLVNFIRDRGTDGFFFLIKIDGSKFW